ncbi:MAG: hypothetical protein JNM38_02735 [Acidobacteria bacterium]|nr:hypothetical protein [Acidobacteriota bacterium]
MPASLPPAFAVSAMYDRLLQAALRRYLSRATLETSATPSMSSVGRLSFEATDDPCALALRWFGTRHVLRTPPERPFSQHEARLARAIGGVLEARYSALFDPRQMAEHNDLFQGVIDDRYIGAFLDQREYEPGEPQRHADQIANAIDVLRVAALSSYENRAISSGVLIVDPKGDSTSERRIPQQPVQYSAALSGVKSFYRLCDGLRTVYLMNQHGHILDIVDIAHWARQASGGRELEVPCAQAFHAHALATLGSSRVCIVLSPTHEIKVFAEGTQVFSFRSATWHLLDLAAKYAQWQRAVGNPKVAQRLFQTALDLSDARQGALFVVLRNPINAIAELVAPADVLRTNPSRDATGAVSRRDFMYLLTARSVIDIDESVLVALASMDGATVTDREGRLMAVGAILRHPATELSGTQAAEGARSTAALAASRFGPVLKVSEDGNISCFDRVKLWEM